ncbi:MAG TPA: hypothetical protein VFU76_03455 [Terriglobales bacterium]|nr:hypothetical protein [Terriglobales bacterium]
MGSLSPLQIVLIIIAGLSALAVILTLLRNRSTFSGYEEIQSDVRQIASGMGGEFFRDGDDLVINGNYQNRPVVIRFSNAENTPGLNMRMQAPTTFTMTVFPTGERAAEAARVPVRTADDQFDARFQTRSDQPTQAKMFLDRPTTSLLQRLMCSKNTFLSVGGSALELSELIIPASAGQHVMDHLKQFLRMDEALKAMPGADTVKVVPLKRERHLAGRAAIAIGAAVALMSIFAATRVPSRATAPSAPQLPAGVLPVDAAAIPEISSYRLATEADFDTNALGWLQGNRLDAQGRMPADFSGTGHGRDVAYFLIGPKGERRIVLLNEGVSRYDAILPSVAAVSVIPKDQLSRIEWFRGQGPANASGDGLLVIRNANDPASALVLLLNDNQVISFAPANYENIVLQ